MGRSLVQRAVAGVVGSVLLTLAVLAAAIAAAFVIFGLLGDVVGSAAGAALTAVIFAVIALVAALLLPSLLGLRPGRAAHRRQPEPIDPATTRMMLEAGATVADVLNGFTAGRRVKARGSHRGKAKRHR